MGARIMAKCAYFYDKVTHKIIGMNVHHVRDEENPHQLKSVDCDLSGVWEEIRTGKKWPHFLASVTDQKPENLELIYADDISHGYNEYEPTLLDGTTQLKRRPYFCLKIKPHPNILEAEEKEDCCLYEVDTEGSITLEMEVCVKRTQDTIERHDEDKNVRGINGVFLAEATVGRLTPRDGKIEMKNSKATFQWTLSDTTAKEPARCYVKDPDGNILISKSLRVNCC